MNRFVTLAVVASLALGLLLVPVSGQAQFGSLKDKVKKKVEDKADKETDKAVDDAVDEGFEKGVDAATGSGDSDTPSEKAEASEAAESESAPSAAESSTPTGGTETTGETAGERPGSGVWLNYDFVPGDRVLFYEDFADDYVGDFPLRLEFVSGNMEVAEWNGENYLRIPGKAEFDIALDRSLPEKFTLEMGLHLGTEQFFYIYTCDAGWKKSYNASAERVELHRTRGDKLITKVERKGQGAVTEERLDYSGLVELRLMVSDRYLKVYVDETRVANIPNSQLPRATNVRFHTYYNEREETFIRDMRLAEGGRTILYKQLEAEGRVATRGIYFDSGSDVIRPESTPTLKEIGKMLDQHADLNLLIEGHTDNQGDDTYNQELSEKRAAAVKTYICSEYGVAGDRLQTDGFGESKPVDSNDTPEGRQNNRRVELVKL
ncbi:MAG: OmpA family protein [candidate division Zixibacteria bacterium]|nr:OmpA family protein [candidate division Zixibacteria bacterium]